MGKFSWTRWDRQLFARAFASGGVVWLLGLLVTAVTDEGGVALVTRVARTLPFAPVACGLGSAMALAPLVRRGETRALAALGQRPTRTRLGVFAGSMSLAILASLALFELPRGDLAAFFPVAESAEVVVNSGDFVDARTGQKIYPMFEPAERKVVRPKPTPREEDERVAIWLLLNVTALGTILYSLSERKMGEKALATTASFLAISLVLHAVGGRGISPYASLIPGGVLLLYGMWSISRTT